MFHCNYQTQLNFANIFAALHRKKKIEQEPITHCCFDRNQVVEIHKFGIILFLNLSEDNYF